MIIDFSKYNNKEEKKPFLCLVVVRGILTQIEQLKSSCSKPHSALQS